MELIEGLALALLAFVVGSILYTFATGLPGGTQGGEY